MVRAWVLQAMDQTPEGLEAHQVIAETVVNQKVRRVRNLVFFGLVVFLSVNVIAASFNFVNPILSAVGVSVGLSIIGAGYWLLSR